MFGMYFSRGTACHLDLRSMINNIISITLIENSPSIGSRGRFFLYSIRFLLINLMSRSTASSYRFPKIILSIPNFIILKYIRNGRPLTTTLS